MQILNTLNRQETRELYGGNKAMSLFSYISVYGVVVATLILSFEFDQQPKSPPITDRLFFQKYIFSFVVRPQS